MSRSARTIGSRWWAILFRLTAGVLCPLFVIAATWHGIAASGDWLSPIALLSITLLLVIFSLLLITSINGLHYRLVIDGESVAVRGLLFTRTYLWSEVVEICAVTNLKLPGYHAAIRVDGSNNRRRDTLMLWSSHHHILFGMELGGMALSKTLRQRWRAWQRANARQTSA